MKKALLFLMLCLLLLAGTAHAVSIQQGWYVEAGYINLVGFDQDKNQWMVNWMPTSITGQFGPVLIQGTGYQSRFGRRITFSQSVDLPSGVIWEDSGTYSGSYPYYNEVRVGWVTDYDATKLQLQVLRRRAGAQDELVWWQTGSGYLGNYANIWYSGPLMPGDSVVARLVVVPEPSGLLLLGGAIPVYAWLARRKMR